MKKILLLLIFTLIAFFAPISNINTFAKDVVPTSPNLASINAIGIYQVGDDIPIYKEPNNDSQILYRIRYNKDEFFPEEIGFEKFFMVFLPEKSLALVGVTDYLDDWIEIVYDNSTGKTGWIKKDDPYKFMTWNNFYNSYGKKYGLKLLKSAPESCKDIKAATDEKSKTLSTINYPKKINLNVIRGNWALVSVLDLDRTPKTGYIRWRSDNGVRYYFPDVK